MEKTIGNNPNFLRLWRRLLGVSSEDEKQKTAIRFYLNAFRNLRTCLISYTPASGGGPLALAL